MSTFTPPRPHPSVERSSRPGNRSARWRAASVLLLLGAAGAACGGSDARVQAPDGAPGGDGRAGAGGGGAGGSGQSGGAGAAGAAGAFAGRTGGLDAGVDRAGGGGPAPADPGRPADRARPAESGATGGSRATGGAGAIGGSGATGGTAGGAGSGVDAGGPVYSCAPGASADAGAGGAPSVDGYGSLGGPCTSLGALACAGAAQQQSLLCTNGIWKAFTSCAADQRCDSTDGICAAVASPCQGHAPGDSVCDQDTLVTCGRDLVSVARALCCGTCVAGACSAPRCGDGKIEGTEGCDDGNLAPGDGCEPNCQPTQVLQLAAGRAHTCALLTGGRVRCWGANDQGQLGLGTTTDSRGQPPYKNALVSLGGPAASIAAGADHTCALMVDGTLRCWGANGHGQLGLGNTNGVGDNELPSAKPAINLGLGVTTVAAGGNCTCAILDDATLRCWGQNNYGQLGLGHTHDIGDDEIPSQTFAQVSVGGGVSLVATGGNFTCAILTDGHTGRCWGQNGLGQLGLGVLPNIGDNELPTSVASFVFPSTSAVASIVSGQSRSSALLVGLGINYCWGDNSDGGLGISEVGPDPLVLATGWPFGWPAPARQIAAGGFHMCVGLADDELWCWGLNAKGQLGQPNTNTLGDNESVVEVPAIDLGVGADGFPSYAVSMTAGAAHTCVILGDGRVLCWGANESGQLGLGYASAPPVDYVGGTPDTVPAKLPAIRVSSP